MTQSEIQLLKSIALDAYKAWDSDQDMRVGKILRALSGGMPNYRADIDSLLYAREQSDSREIHALEHRIKQLEWSLRQCDILARRNLHCREPVANSWEFVRDWCEKAGVDSSNGVMRTNDEFAPIEAQTSASEPNTHQSTTTQEGVTLPVGEKPACEWPVPRFDIQARIETP